VTPHVERFPALTEAKVSPPSTRTAVVLFVVVPSPSSPKVLSPQQYVVPSGVTPHVWELPALTAAKVSRISNGALVAPASAPEVALTVKPVPGRSMLSVGNVATPFTAATLVVPDSVPPLGLVPIATVTLPVKLVTAFPPASCAVTFTAGVIGASGTALLG